MSNIKLKPCPFCGGVARIASVGETVVFVTCQTCHVGTQGISVSAEYCANEKAAEEWNRRADVPPRANWTREDFTSYDGETIKNGAAVCGRCKKAFFMPTDTFDYCPNCGARMNDGEDHG
ncbi:Lar family restriction alleviation protein [Ruminococcus sp. CAG:330]|uniref:Lar family restriction alleviation protein n=1 Tax=Ruminococcus sp. CAG:330 TaxID=1262954 RepID=UPI00263F97A0|nr:Lar family restriction alleviation protein [Ruminococcus sp. CAG:330]